MKKSYAIEAQFKREFENEDEEEDEEEDDDESTKTNNIGDYKSWMKQRRRLRNHLNKLDLDVNYLRRKKNLTELERKVLNRLLYIDKEIQTDPIVTIFDQVLIQNIYKNFYFLFFLVGKKRQEVTKISHTENCIPHTGRYGTNRGLFKRESMATGRFVR